MSRLFVASDMIQGSRIVIEGREFRHAVKVLRLRAGDIITVIDGTDAEYSAMIVSITARSCVAEITGIQGRPCTPSRQVTLYQAFIKVPRFEMILEKATELGVSAIVPVQSSRSAPVDPGTGKYERWERILRSAACQCGRNDIPRLGAPLPFSEALENCDALRSLILSPAGRSRRISLQNMEQGNLSLFLGPEGGFSDEEIESARVHGLQEISLGPRILRAETAAMAALAILSYELEICFPSLWTAPPTL